MEKLLLDLETAITNGQERAKNTEELFQLLSSYNAYCILLLKAQQEYERKNANIKQYYLYSNCYKEQIGDLFSLFKNDEYLIGKLIKDADYNKKKDMLFLIDQDTLLRINSFNIWNSRINGLAHIDYNLLKINNCKGKIYKQKIYCGDPYYCDYSWQEKDAFGFFCNDNLVTPGYVLDSKFSEYTNVDIREILKVQSLDEIHKKINEAKEIKAKKLILKK